MTNYKYFRITGLIIGIGIFLTVIFNLGMVFFIFYSFMIGVLILKFVYFTKKKEFEKKRKMLILHQLLRNHCKGIKVRDKWYKKAYYINQCVYYTKDVCMNKCSITRTNCINNYVMLMNQFAMFKAFKLVGKKIIEFYFGKDETKENC